MNYPILWLAKFWSWVMRWFDGRVNMLAAALPVLYTVGVELGVLRF